MQVLQLRGDIDRYLKLVSGVANLNLFNLVRDGLLVELRAAIYQAQRQEVPCRKDGLRLAEGDQARLVNLQVMPFKVPTAEAYRFLVLFEDAPPADSLAPIDPARPQVDLEQEIARLRQELAAALQERAATQEYLQAVIQEQEHSNQDLKVANEEILSSNEELQSTNEELETAKEEIQATNEELSTTNEELRSRNGELHQVNNDLTNLLASINIPILMLTNDLRIRRFTPMAQRLFNFIPTDAGRPLSDISTNLNLPALELLLLEVLETLNVKELEVQTQGGHWYMLRIRPYRTTENQIDGVVLVLLDIDDLKHSAATVEAARNYAEAIVETVQVPLVVLESDLRVNKANQAFYDTFQVSPPETAQALLFDWGNGQWNIPGLRSLLEAVFSNEAVLQNFEVEHRFEQIGQKTMLLNALKLVEAGEAPRLLLSIEDITERSQLLTQEQSARQEAETANRAKDEFLSNLSHELRNPLNTMLGWAQMLRRRQLNEPAVSRALEVIERSARAQAQLIEDMLDLSRITSGKLHLNAHLLDLVSVVAPAIESVQLAAEAKAIQLVTQLTAATVVGDANRLQQVLWNLLSNAIKFTPVGGQVEVRLEQVGEDEEAREDFSADSAVSPAPPVSPASSSLIHAQITVSDTGQGMSAELLPYVFDRFRQGNSSTTKGSQGLGLGLSIVRQLVELHGGTVQADSPGEGQGTTMTVRLPLQASPAIPASLAPTAAELLNAGSPAVPALEGLRLLVVDDDVDSLELMQYMLTDAGATVTVVTSVREAIAALTSDPSSYDVLLADIGMPNEDGFALIRQVRALDAAAGGQIPAAAITAYVSDREQQMAIDAGFQRHMAKPIDPTQLILLVANLVGRVGRA